MDLQVARALEARRVLLLWDPPELPLLVPQERKDSPEPPSLVLRAHPVKLGTESQIPWGTLCGVT